MYTTRIQQLLQDLCSWSLLSVLCAGMLQLSVARSTADRDIHVVVALDEMGAAQLAEGANGSEDTYICIHIHIV